MYYCPTGAYYTTREHLLPNHFWILVTWCVTCEVEWLKKWFLWALSSMVLLEGGWLGLAPLSLLTDHRFGMVAGNVVEFDAIAEKEGGSTWVQDF